VKIRGFPVSVIQALHKDEWGISMIEYGVMLALIAVVALGIITALGRTVSGTFDNLNVRVQGPGSLETRVAPEGTVKP